MVEIEKDGMKLKVPYNSYIADYKDYGWKIVGKKQQEKETVAPTNNIIKEEKIEKQEEKEERIEDRNFKSNRNRRN